ncbi:hypothetical protein ACFL1W_01410 [Candidatus Margulisiibacteriota bacterium]
MLQTYLINALIFAGVLLVIALVAGVIVGVFILIDFRRVSKEISKKVVALTSVVDIVSLFMGGIGGAKNRLKKKVKSDDSTMISFIAGVKKGLQVLLKKQTREE